MPPIDKVLRRWRALPASARSLIKLLLPVVLVLAYVAWAYTRMPGAILYGHNHTDRPVFSYFVNEAWGGQWWGSMLHTYRRRCADVAVD